MTREESPSTAADLGRTARTLVAAMERLRFGAPVTHVYNPLVYAWRAHEAYLKKYGNGRKRVVFLGMNPGPFGMAQTGVPFGEINAVRGWLKIEARVDKPPGEHPRRPVLGFACPRSEISGRRLWGLLAKRFGRAEDFFTDHFVINYCPLIFFEASGRNRTPDKLPASELAPVLSACDAHLRQVIAILQPEWLVGVGRFAEKRAKAVFPDGRVRIESISHPSPASPAANRDWTGTVEARLRALGIWS